MVTRAAPLVLAALAAGCGTREAPTYPPVALEPAVGCAPRPASAAVIPAGPVDLWVAPAGAGDACTELAPCTLRTGFDRLHAVAGAMVGDVRILLADGTYALSQPLELCEDGGAHDSGTNGYRVVIEAAPGANPVLSGGRRIGPWEPAPGRSGVFRAAAPGLRTRQLYVNGVRAVRARDDAAPGQYQKTPGGFVRRDSALLGVDGLERLEVVGRSVWRTFRCPVAVVSTYGFTSLVVAEPCWSNSQGERTHGEDPFEKVSWIENALALLDAPGEWFLDESAGFVYYAPRPGESLDAAEVIAPTQETLLWASGGADSSGAPTYLHDVTLRGLAFRDTTWLAPSGPDGHAEYQAGFRRVGDNRLAATPGALSLARVQRVRVERCTFARLGGVGLAVAAGSKDVEIVGNAFADISSSAIQAGDVAFATATDDVRWTRRVAATNNVVRRAAVEYEGAIGIFVGYAEGTRVEHNDVADLPYTGISVGWGWTHDPSDWATSNVVAANHVRDVMTLLHDGGGLYLVGPQPASRVEGNWVERSGGVGIYLDQASVEITASGNVLESTRWWLDLWTDSIRRNVVTGNWATADVAYCLGTTAPSAACNFGGNVVGENVFGEPFPPAAEAVRAAAGLEAGWRDVAPPP